jgi:predicted phosphodiesterase
MELQLNQRPLLIATMALMLTACSDEIVVFSPGESVDDRFLESMNWNMSHPSSVINVETDDYSVLTIADIHVGATVNLDRFLNIAQTEMPAAVIIDGDLTGGLPEEYVEFENHFPNDESLTSFYVAGNHDLWHNGWEEFYSRFGSSSYYFSVKTPVDSDLYVCIDTGGGTLGELQTEWLTKILKLNRPDYRRCVVITHVNLFRPRKTESTNLVEEELCCLIDLFAENKVDMVITGHDHVSDAQIFGITEYIQIDALEDGLSNAGYMKMNVTNGKINYNFVLLNDAKNSPK